MKLSLKTSLKHSSEAPMSGLWILYMQFLSLIHHQSKYLTGQETAVSIDQQNGITSNVQNKEKQLKKTLQILSVKVIKEQCFLEHEDVREITNSN